MSNERKLVLIYWLASFPCGFYVMVAAVRGFHLFAIVDDRHHNVINKNAGKMVIFLNIVDNLKTAGFFDTASMYSRAVSIGE